EGRGRGLRSRRAGRTRRRLRPQGRPLRRRERRRRVPRGRRQQLLRTDVMERQDPQEAPKPFWKTAMMWLVIGLPTASVFASMALVVIATRSGGADVVRDDVQRVSQIQTTDL